MVDANCIHSTLYFPGMSRCGTAPERKAGDTGVLKGVPCSTAVPCMQGPQALEGAADMYWLLM